MNIPKVSVLGIIFFPTFVISGHLINKEIDLKGYITGGRLWIQLFIAGLIGGFAPIGWIYAFSKMSEIEALREKLANKLVQH